jgi:hypothetical protein
MRGLYDGLPVELTPSQARGFGNFFFWSGLVATPINFIAFLMFAAVGHGRTVGVFEVLMVLVVVLALGAIAARLLKRPATASLIAALQLPTALLFGLPLLSMILLR